MVCWKMYQFCNAIILSNTSLYWLAIQSTTDEQNALLVWVMPRWMLKFEHVML